MKVAADQIISPITPSHRRNGIRFSHTDHPVWPEPSPYDTKWANFAIDPNGKIVDLAGWQELTTTPFRWALLGAGAGFLFAKGFSGLALGAVAGFFAGPKLQNAFQKLQAAKQVTETVVGK